MHDELWEKGIYTKMSTGHDLKVAFLGNYLPRKCGIATFTYDLENVVNKDLKRNDSTFVVAMNNIEEGYPYPERVRKTIYQPNLHEYLKAAEFINESDVDVVCVQHEFGIFGGEGGEYVLEFLRHLRKPSIITLHTIFCDPPDVYKRITTDMASLSHGFVVMSERAVAYLHDKYGIAESKVRMIHHGVPNMGFTDPNGHKSKFGFDGRTVLGTFGLLSRNKGIEHVINVLPDIISKYPDVLYVLLGETHPEVVKHSGEEYRESLLATIDKLGINDNVRFISKFLDVKELVDFLAAVDIYITPYKSREQITSGTLAYSLAAGKPIISTPYWYAQELLDEGRGIIVDFGDEQAIGKSIFRLLENDDERNAIREKAFRFGRRMTWPETSKRYIEYFNEAKLTRVVFEIPRSYFDMKSIKPLAPVQVIVDGSLTQPQASNSLPRLNLGHIHVLTDDTGIIQHASYSVPNRTSGYCIDDNSRALIAAIRAQEFFPDQKNIHLIKNYLSFIRYAQLDDGRFHNFMGYDRRFLDNVGSEDSFGRTLWALCYLIEHAPKLNDIGIDTLAREIHDRAIVNLPRLESPRALAYSMLGLFNYLGRFPKDNRARELIRDFSRRLINLYRGCSQSDWRWFEPYITYDNGKFPQALYLAGEILHERECFQVARESLDFLTAHIFENNIFMPIGTNGWFHKGHKKAQFDQQPIEGSSMIDAYLTAARSNFSTPSDTLHFERLAQRVWNWYNGANVTAQPLYDSVTGACADGITSRELSLNQGAESTICAVLALQSMRKNLRMKTMDHAIAPSKRIAPSSKSPEDPLTVKL